MDDLTTAHRPAAASAPALTDLVVAVRHVIALRADWARTGQLVADRLRTHLPGKDILTPHQRRGHPDRPAGHLLHAEPDGTFRRYWLRVPPNTRTAREGVAWTFGLTAEEYRPLVQT